jgi:DNA-binding HxlR family transcriptional regulator
MRDDAKKATPPRGWDVSGQAVHEARAHRPIMDLLDLVGRRWALRVLWELRLGAATFRQLRERCGGISPTVLNQRLHELREAGIVELEEGVGYRSTKHGTDLLHALAPLDDWARAWAKRRRNRP